MKKQLAKEPKVSIVILSYNYAEYIIDAINSVMNQDYNNIQLIIVDDCSTDNSTEIIENLLDEYQFEFVKNETNLGVNGALLRGMSAVRGEYVSWLSCDDLIAPTKISDQITYLVNNSLDVVYSSGYILTKTAKPKLMSMEHIASKVAAGTILEYLYVTDVAGPMIQSALVKTSLANSLFFIRQQFKSDDWALTIKLFETGKAGFLNKPLFYYRLHDKNSHRDYWKTLPMRMDVVCNLTPPRLRNIAISNLLCSQAQYLVSDGKLVQGIQFFLSSLMIKFQFRQIISLAKSFAKLTLKKLNLMY